MKITRSLFLVLAVGAGVAFAADYQVQDLSIDHPWARATPPGAMTGGAFVTIENKGKVADKLVDASSPAAKIVEIHEMWMDGGMMKMRAVSGIDVKPGARTELRPGGYHIMLMDLRAPLKVGDRIPLTLVFEKAGKVDVSVQVEGMGAAAGAEPMKH